MNAKIVARFTREGRTNGTNIYEGDSLAEAKRAAAKALGYKDIRSAYSYTSSNQYQEEALFFCRRRDSYRDDFDVVEIVVP